MPTWSASGLSKRLYQHVAENFLASQGMEDRQIFVIFSPTIA
jgi:hypothetical protein